MRNKEIEVLTKKIKQGEYKEASYLDIMKPRKDHEFPSMYNQSKSAL